MQDVIGQRLAIVAIIDRAADKAARSFELSAVRRADRPLRGLGGEICPVFPWTVGWVKRREAGEEAGGDTEEEKARRFRSVCVFDVAQTEGKPLPEFAQARGEPGKFTGRLKEFAAELGIHVEISGALVSAHGLSSGGRILVRKGLPAAEEFSVLAHELAHELLHKAEEEKPSSRTVRETEAEAVAFVVC